VVAFRNVTKVFGTGASAVRAVNDLSFALARGEFASLMGPSGSGKTTVLHLIASLTAPTGGSIVVDGDDLSTRSASDAAAMRRRRIGYILQSFNLMPFLTAAENVGMPLVLDGVRQSEVDARVAAALAMVTMSHRKAHLPNQLSGGEQQRVAVARALAIEPAIILADEPTGNLDRAAAVNVMNLLRDVNERTGVTILLVTHDPEFGAYARRVLGLVDGALEPDGARQQGN
jgi:putative ABC transport system ATP-binding protein